VHTALQRLRKVADEFPGRVLIGETWTGTPEALAAFYGPSNNELQLPMYFNLTMVNKLDAPLMRQRVDAVEKNPAGGWPTFVLSNHDIPRHIERYGDGKNDEAIARLMAAFVLTLRGTPILYYGEEIGMTNNDPKRIEDVRDVIGKRGWPLQKGRDGERTPMQWDSSVNAGFNQGATPWLPVNPDYVTKNAAGQSADPKSMLNWYRSLIRLRREQSALAEGDYVALLEDDASVLAYLRRAEHETVLAALHMSSAAQTVEVKGAGGEEAAGLLSSSQGGRVDLGPLSLEPFGVRILKLKGGGEPAGAGSARR